MRIESGQNRLVAAWVAMRQGEPPSHNWGGFNTLAFYDDRGLKVALVYNHFVWPSIGIHIAARAGAIWATPETFWHIFSYPFDQLNCFRVTAPVKETNVRCRRLVERLGFRLEGTLRKAFPGGESLLVYGMLREECSWIERKNYGYVQA